MSTQRPTPASGWALSGAMFAAVMMMLIGVFQIAVGFAAIFEDDFYVVTTKYAFEFDVTVWGWIHLILGIVVLLGGFALVRGKVWAGILAITMASLSAIANFLFIPYYPFWSLLVIAIDVWIIWSLTRPGALES